jgi:competence protein ComEC
MPAVLPALLVGTVLGVLGRDAGLWPVSSPWLLIAGGLGSCVGLLLRSRRLLIGGILLAAVCLGGWRGAGVALPSGPGSVQALIGDDERSIIGTVVDDPRPRGERQQVVLDDIFVATPESPVAPGSAGRVLLWLPRGLSVVAGDRLQVEAALEAPRDFDGFAYRAYLARQGIAATASARAATLVDHKLPPIAEATRASRDWLLRGLNRLVPEPEAALAAGIVLGVRSGIDPAISADFSSAGLTHVVAISGWNIAIVAALAAAAASPLRRLRGGRWLAVAASACTVGGYVLLTGASPSVVRAALMAGGLVLARLGGSRSHALSALALAALLMILVAPAVVWDVGFQLSALATAGLVWFGAAFERRLSRWPGLVREPVALTLAAQLTTLPIILLNFERLSLVAPVANVIVVPLVPIVMLTSALAALAGAVQLPIAALGDVVAWLTGGSAWLYLRVMIVAGHLAAAVPMASVPLSAPPWLAGAWYPIVLVVARRSARDDVTGDLDESGPQAPSGRGGLLRPRILAALTVVVLAALTIATQPDGRLHVLALDIGQGDSILVVAPDGSTLLVDGGPDPDLVLRRLGEKLPFWQRSITAMVLTHPHEDHVAGLVPVLERFRVGSALDPARAYDNPSYARFLALAATEAPGVYRLARAGEHVSLGPAVDVEVLYPTDEDAAAPLPEGDVNNASVVLLLRSGTFSALLTGDAEAPVEAKLLDRGEVPDVDLLKVGHHGSDSSSTPEFLAAARPEVALISCGVGNDYGHPHAITLEHLAAIPGLVTHRTDLEGTVEVVVEADGSARTRSATVNPGSIGPWWFPVATRRWRCSTRWGCRRGSSRIRRASPAWRPKPRASSARPACRSTCGWSRPRPCCMTSTNSRRAMAAGSTARWRPIA